MDSRPNILVVLTDQQRADTIRALGSRFAAETPCMDELVRRGVAFTNCFCTAPVCSPSRSTILTGFYPDEAGMPGNLNSCPECPPLSPSVPSLAVQMRAAGYQTAYHGKWHLGGVLSDHGFDVCEECSHDSTTGALASRFWRDRDWVLHEKPFFHIVSFLDPHDIYFLDPERATGGGFKLPWPSADRPDDDYPPTPAALRRPEWGDEMWGNYHEFYARRLERVDRQIGDLLEELKCSGFAPNTWVIFASDHGDMGGEQRIPFKGPFHYDGVTKVPFIIRPPETRFLGDSTRRVETEPIQPGQRDALCSLIDLVPTVLDLAGVSPLDVPRQGVSLIPWVRGEKSGDAHDEVHALWHRPGVRMVRSRTFKLVQYDDGGEELFDLIADPGESRNCAADPKMEPVLSSLRAKMRPTHPPRAA